MSAADVIFFGFAAAFFVMVLGDLVVSGELGWYCRRLVAWCGRFCRR